MHGQRFRSGRVEIKSPHEFELLSGAGATTASGSVEVAEVHIDPGDGHARGTVWPNEVRQTSADHMGGRDLPARDLTLD